MSSSTPNINLTLPVGSEHVSRQIINENNTKIDAAVGTLNSKIIKKDISMDSVSGSDESNFISNAISAINTRFPFSGLALGSVLQGDVPWSGHNYYAFTATKSGSDQIEIEFLSNAREIICRYTISNGTIKNEELALNSKLSNVTFKDVSNVNNFTVNLGYTPSASNYGQLIVFNANQGSLNMISIGNATNIVKVYGNITLTASISGQNITVEASGTLWGSTIVMISHN